MAEQHFVRPWTSLQRKEGPKPRDEHRPRLVSPLGMRVQIEKNEHGVVLFFWCVFLVEKYENSEGSFSREKYWG